MKERDHMEILDLSGIWQCEIPGHSAPMRLPGTLDESYIGFPDSIMIRLMYALCWTQHATGTA